MEIIVENLELSKLILLMVVSPFIVFEIVKYSLNKYYYHITWFLQKTVFKSHLIPFVLLYTFIILFILISLSLISDSESVYEQISGYILLGLAIYLLVKIYNSTRNSKLNIKDNFKFQKYTTKVSYYNDQSQEYKIQCYNSIIDRIKRMTFNTIDNQQYKTILINDYLLNIESLITFEYFDAKIYNSISDHTTGVLFYSKFHKNILEILSRINKLTNNLQSIDYNYRAITSILLNLKFLRFDDNYGVNYNIDLVDIEIERIFINKNEESASGKELNLISNSLENIQMIINNNYQTTSLNNNLLMMLEETVTEIKKTIQISNSYKTYKLPEEKNFTMKDVITTLINSFVIAQKIQLLPENRKDIEKFVKDRFRNHSNKQPARIPKYINKEFFIEHRKEFFVAISKLVTEFDLQKALLANIIFDEFPEMGYEINTIKEKISNNY